MILPTKQHEAIHLSLLMLFVFLLPLHSRLASLSVIFLGLHWLLSGAPFRNFKLLLQPLPVLFLSFYGLHLLGMTYTSNEIEGMQKLETNLPLLVFPLILFSFPVQKTSDRYFVLKSFVLGCLVSSIYSTGCAFVKYCETEDNWLYYERLSSFLGFHPTYYSMYLSFALFTVLFFLMKNFKTESSIKRLAGITLSCWFFLFILLLSSRMTILATSAILGMSFIIGMSINRRLWQGIVIGIIGIVLLFFLVKTLPGLKIRTIATEKRIEKQAKKEGVSDPRINIWKAASEVVQKNLIQGTGTGDVQDELVKVYKKRNYQKELNKNYNAHNQFLQTTISLGIIGGLLLLMYLFIPFKIAFLQKDYLYMLFLALVILSFLAESMLQRQWGTLFFGFFHTFFATGFLNKNIKSRDKKRARL